MGLCGSIRWVSMLEGNSIGEFEAPQTWRVAEDPVDVIVSDLDKNGLDEVLVVSCATEALSVVLDAATGHRLKIIELPPGSAPSEILLRDMDQDGEDEVLVLRSGSRSVALPRHLVRA